MDTPTAVPPTDSSGCSARALQLRAASFAFPDSSRNIQMHESSYTDVQQQFGDRMLPNNGYCGNGNVEGGGGGYNAPLSPPSTLPLPWCHGLSSDADYFGPATVRLLTLNKFNSPLYVC